MANLSWNTRTQIAYGTVGSDNYPNSSKYIFRLYATATRNGRNASLYIEYTIQSGGQHYGSADPYWSLYVDRTQRAWDYKHELYEDSEVTLGTYTKSLTADYSGNFGSTPIEGRWVNESDAGYCPNSLNISDTVYLPSIDPIGVRVKHNGTWKTGLAFVKRNGSWASAVVYAKQNGQWKGSS